MCPRPKIHGLGPNIHLKSPLAPQQVPLKLDSMPPSKGPFSAHIHPIIPTLFVPIPQGRCFRKMVGSFSDNARVGEQNPSEITLSTLVGTIETSIQCHFRRAHSPRIYIRSFPNFLCLYVRACAFGKWWRVPSENAWLGAQNPSENTLSTPACTTET